MRASCILLRRLLEPLGDVPDEDGPLVSDRDDGALVGRDRHLGDLREGRGVSG